MRNKLFSVITILALIAAVPTAYGQEATAADATIQVAQLDSAPTAESVPAPTSHRVTVVLDCRRDMAERIANSATRPAEPGEQTIAEKIGQSVTSNFCDVTSATLGAPGS